MSAACSVDAGVRRGCDRPRPARRQRSRPRAPRAAAPRWPAPSRRPRTRCPGPPPPAGARRRTSSRRRSTAQPVITSVSGRGTKTPGSDGELQVPEVGSTGQVLQRHPLGPAGDQTLRTRRGLIGRPAACCRRGRAVRSRSMCASSTRASTAGLSTPAARSRSVAVGEQSGDRYRCSSHRSGRGGQPLGGVGLEQSRDHRVQIAVEHLIEVVGLEADAVVGDPVLGEVVGPDPLGAVDGADLAPPGRGRRRRPPPPRRRRSAGPGASAWPAPGSAAGSARSGRRRRCRVGRWVIRTAESVVLTPCPPGPDER